jgi:Na+/H+-dicarboxylate symporter
VPWATLPPATKMTNLNHKFQVFERIRARNAIGLGVLFLALLLIVGYSWERTQPYLDPVLDVGASPFFWYLGGIQETGPIGLIAFLLDIIVYALGFYALLSLRHYLAWRRTRSRP